MTSTPTKRAKEWTPPSCSFCGKDQRQTKKMIAGPQVFICDECLLLCFDVMAEDSSCGLSPAEQRASRFRAKYLGVVQLNDRLIDSLRAIEGQLALHREAIAAAPLIDAETAKLCDELSHHKQELVRITLRDMVDDQALAAQLEESLLRNLDILVGQSTAVLVEAVRDMLRASARNLAQAFSGRVLKESA